jgi:hypothetical protein
MVLIFATMVYFGAWRKPINEENLKTKISCQTPLKQERAVAMMPYACSLLQDGDRKNVKE